MKRLERFAAAYAIEKDQELWRADEGSRRSPVSTKSMVTLMAVSSEFR